MQDVVLEQQVAFGVHSDSVAVSWTSVAGSTPAGAVYADPQLLTWDYGTEQLVDARPLAEAGPRFLTTGSFLTSLQEVMFSYASRTPDA